MLRTTVAAAALLSFGSVAQATSISISQFDMTQFNALTANAVVEDFEDQSQLTGFFENGDNVDGNGPLSTTQGEIQGVLGTQVGTFGTLGGTGSGSTCQSFDLLGNNCSNIALQDDAINGQGNVFPQPGDWSLNSNDTDGIIWKAALAGGTLISQLIFAVKDAADVGDKLATVTVDGKSESITNQLNSNEQMVVITFGTAVAAADVEIFAGVNDGFTVDGTAISPVPLPASSLLLIGGMAALGGIARRRKNKKA